MNERVLHLDAQIAGNPVELLLSVVPFLFGLLCSLLDLREI